MTSKYDFIGCSELEAKYLEEIPTDIWDYIEQKKKVGELADFPFPQDRKRIIAKANQTRPIKHQSAELKDEHPKRPEVDLDGRYRVWDYFFPVDVIEINKLLKLDLVKYGKERGRLTKDHQLVLKRNKQIRNKYALRRVFYLLIAIIIFVFQAGAFLNLAITEHEINLNGWHLGLLATCLITLMFCFYTLSQISFMWAEYNRIKSECDDKYTSLYTIVINMLKQGNDRKNDLIQQIPESPRPEEIKEILDKDIREIQNYSFETYELEFYRNEMVTVISVAELQEDSELPSILRKNNETSINRSSHLRAKDHKIVSDRSLFFSGIYLIQFVAVADVMLTFITFYYDFIAGELLSERFEEYYLNDITNIEIRRELKEIFEIESTGTEGQYVDVEAPQIECRLASGQRRSISFLSQDYFLHLPSYEQENEPEILANAQTSFLELSKQMRQFIRQKKDVKEKGK